MKYITKLVDTQSITAEHTGYLSVAAKKAAHMNDYTKALHQQFYREPDFNELEECIENTRHEVRDCLDKFQPHRLMHLVDT